MESWYCLHRSLGRKGVENWISGRFYVAFVQVILLFGLETWVVTLQIKCMLGGFHHRVAKKILGKIPQQWAYGSWAYPLLGGTRRADGIKEIETYISRRKNTVVQYIAINPIMDL